MKDLHRILCTSEFSEFLPVLGGGKETFTIKCEDLETGKTFKFH